MPTSSANLPRMRPATDLIERDDAFYIYMDMPGVPKDQVRVEVDDNELVVFAEAMHGINPVERLHALEFGDAEYRALFTLSDTVDTEKITAKTENGVLEVILPKRTKTMSGPVRIDVA